MKIERNLGTLDRFLRAGISLIMLYYGLIDTTFFTDPIASIILSTMGCASMLVVVVGNCPLYKVIGINTAETRDKPAGR
jgi:hypothetical protein